MSFPDRHILWQSVSRSDVLDIPETDSCISNECEQLFLEMDVISCNLKCIVEYGYIIYNTESVEK